ncbi:MAG: XRE family transcriptional regulator [Ignavibacteria bacterium]|nr:XRE family transcriptional regulator [Ignavibacteria bacterium]
MHRFAPHLHRISIDYKMYSEYISERTKRLNTFGERLDYLLGDVTNADAERLTGISNELISRWRRGKGNPTLDKLELLKKYFGEKYTWLLTGEESAEGRITEADVKYISGKVKNVPVVGSVPCGIPVANWEVERDKLLKIADIGHLHNPFVLIAKGDSMSPYINNKDMLLCADIPEKVKKNGGAVVVSFNAEPDTTAANAKLIKWNTEKKEIMLYSINTKYQPEVYALKDVYKIYKVVRIIREVN